jgi:hypothetical protein
MMKAMSRKLTKAEPALAKRKFAMVIFSTLCQLTTLHDAGQFYRDVYIVLCSRQHSDAVQNAYNRMFARCTMTKNSVDDDNESDEEKVSDDDNEKMETEQTIKSASPFTAYFSAKVDNLKDGVDIGTDVSNNWFSPGSFRSISSVIHLYPLWSASVQQIEGGRSTNNPQSNASVESHFRSLKHGRLEKRLRLRPRNVLVAELKYVLGKLNEQRLPPSDHRNYNKKAACIQDRPEKWRRTRKTQSYRDMKSKKKILQRGQKPNDTTPIIVQPTLNYELDDAAVDTAQSILKMQFDTIGGLQHPGLGSCKKFLSVPRFSAVDSAFVQILNLPDHWICVTNTLSQHPNNVYLFDSLQSGHVSSQATVQLSSILRRYDDNDHMIVELRRCDRQPHDSRLCGFYAVTFAFLLCAGRDPTGERFNADDIVRFVADGLRNGRFGNVQPTASGRKTNVNVEKIAKVHCLCQRQSEDEMIQCSRCYHWYHCRCVVVSADDKRRDSTVWNCLVEPFYSSYHTFSNSEGQAFPLVYNGPDFCVLYVQCKRHMNEITAVM